MTTLDHGSGIGGTHRCSLGDSTTGAESSGDFAAQASTGVVTQAVTGLTTLVGLDLRRTNAPVRTSNRFQTPSIRCSYSARAVCDFILPHIKKDKRPLYVFIYLNTQNPSKTI